jgi:hypothetical protein
MAKATLNTGNRESLKITWAIKDATDLPADYTAAVINAYIADTAENTTKIDVLTGAGFNPSKNRSENTTEGNSVVQSIDISGEWQVLSQTADEYKTLKTAFNGKKCILVGLIGDPDAIVDPDTQDLTVIAGDEILISHQMKLNFAMNPVDGAEMQIPMDFAKNVKASADTLAAREIVLA